MSVLHVNQIKNKIKELFEKELDTSDISKLDNKNLDLNLTSRCLAAYAVFISTGCAEADAAKSVVDGKNDFGIDAIYFSQNENELIFVQSKWAADGTGGLDEAAALKICQGIDKLFNLEFEGFNAKILAKKNLIENALSSSETRYKIIVIDNFISKDMPEHSNRVFEDWLKKINATGDVEAEPLVTLQHLNQAILHNSLAKGAANSVINIELSMTSWGQILEPYKSYYGCVYLEEIEAIWKNNGVKLFEKNIRQMLGKTDINIDINKTLDTEPENFWYYNNGITILCEKIEKTALGGTNRDVGVFDCKNISIINGAQTVSTIGRNGLECLKSKKIESKVLVKIIEKHNAPEDFEKNVTKNSNKQNKIENRDFVSQDVEQIRLQKEISIEGYNYQLVRSENFKSDSKSFDVIYATAALACSSLKTSLAVTSKNAIGKFFDNLDSGLYKQIYNKGTTGWRVINSVNHLKAIENNLETKINDSTKKSGKKYGILVHGQKIISMLVFQQLKIESEINDNLIEIDAKAINKAVDNVLLNAVNFIEEYYPDSFLASFFKNSAKCNEMVNYSKAE